MNPVVQESTRLRVELILNTPRVRSEADVRSETKLRSFDFLVLDLATAVVGGTLAVVGFFDFVAWLGHDRNS